MQCRSCLRDIPDATHFCGFCGTPSEFDVSKTLTYLVASPASHSPHSPLHNEGRFPFGTVLSGRYRVLNLVGRGGMGEVYRALDLKLDQVVALKFLPETKEGLSDLSERLVAEVRIARQITHPNVCRVYDIGEVDGQPFISMEFVDGEDLRSLLRRIGRLPPDKGSEMARRLCFVLAAAHDKDVLHRDLKPANIMIDSRGHVLITDFGLAAFVGHGGGNAGTPAYMAPEQLNGKEPSVQSDLYSLGLVLFEMFTGKRPFESNSSGDLAAARQARPFLSAGALVRDLDPAIDRTIARCLDPDPQGRPASALAVASGLPGQDPLNAAVAAGETPSPEMVAAAGPLEGLRPRVALLCLLSVIVTLILFTLLSGRASLIEKARLDLSPDALDESARRILRSLGHTTPARDRAHGFFFTPAFVNSQRSGSLPNNGSASNNRWDNSAALAPPLIGFWYRESPAFLEPNSFMCCDSVPGGIGSSDPPPRTAGERLLLLNANGQLEHLDVKPDQIEDVPGRARTSDWSSAFAAAGLRLEDFHPVPPKRFPEFFSDERAAWLGSNREGPPGSLRVEAASLRGRTVFFEIITAATTAARIDPFPSPPAQRVSDVLGVVLITAITTLGLWLALRNLRLRRADQRGAFRLLAIGFTLDILTWGLLGAHVPEINFEWRLAEMAGGWALYRAAILWLFYVALEPYVRRRWPHSMISWSRLLAGRLRDPKLGGDIMIGLASGCVTALLFQIDQSLLRPWVDLGPLIALKGPRQAAGLWLSDLHSSVVLAFLTLLLFLLLRTALRSEWRAVIVFGLLQGGLVAVQSPVDGLVVGVQYFLVALFLVRFGFVTIAVGIFVYTILVSFPITANGSAWYFETGLFALLSILALAVFALQTTLAGRRVMKDETW